MTEYEKLSLHLLASIGTGLLVLAGLASKAQGGKYDPEVAAWAEHLKRLTEQVDAVAKVTTTTMGK